MARNRHDQYTLEIEPESSFADNTGLFSGSELVTRIWGFSPAGDKRNPIGDQAYRRQRGRHPHIPGAPMTVDGAGSFSHYVDGLGTAAGDTVTAAQTGLTRLLEAVCQIGADLTTGSPVKTASSPTTVQMQDDDNDAHALTNSSIGIVPVTTDTGTPVIQARPYRYTAGTDTLDLLMAVDDAPSVGNVLYGAANLAFQGTWTTDVTRALRFLGNANVQHVELLGAVLSGTIGAVGPADVPEWAFALRAANYNKDPSDTRAAATAGLGTVLAGSEILVAAHASTVVKKHAVLSAAFDPQREFLGDLNVNQQAAAGQAPETISGWTAAGDGAPMITLRIPIDETPPAAATAATYHAMHDDPRTDPMHVLLNFGRGQAARSCSIYLPRCYLVEYERVEDDGLAYQELTFEADDEFATNEELCVIALW